LHQNQHTNGLQIVTAYSAGKRECFNLF